MRLPESFLENLKQSSDIVSIMSSYVTLKRTGRDYVCACPFHSEKTPSCHIYPDTPQHFYCFGCHTGGDVITFIRLIEHLDYIESVKLLADRAGIPMPEDGESSDGANRRIRMLEMNREAARYFRDVLLSEQGREGLEYLRERQLTPNTIRKYGLGFAPDGWHNLQMYLRSKGYTDDEMTAAALTVRKNNSVYDKFRRRVMFPIIDRRGNVIAFGGRTLEKDAPAKYLNSDETLVFRKRENIFSLNFAKNTKERFLILCEGYMDVISLNQAGFDSAVATLGTAITSQQANLMKRYAPEVIISYDSDSAGQNAALKAINLLSEAGIYARVLKIPDAKDPDEYIKRFGAENFRQILDGSTSALEFEFNRLKTGAQLSSAAGKAEFLKKAVPFLADIQNGTERTVYISEAARITEQPVNAVEALVNEKRSYNKRSAEKDEEKKVIRELAARDPVNPDAVRYPAEEKAERGIIAYIFHSPDKIGYIRKKLSYEDFPTEFNRGIFVMLSEKLKNGESIDLSALGQELSTQEISRITGIRRAADELPYSLPRLDEYIERLIRFREKRNEKPPSEMTDEEMQKKIEEKRRKLKGS